MKKFIPSFIIALLFVVVSNNTVFSQASVPSSTGYTVHITVLPVSIIPSSLSCPFGYNYNLNLNYTVTFTGTNIPASLYTLQGTIGCGASTHFFSLPTGGGSGSLVTGSNVWNPHTDCATATPASLLCNTASIQIEGPGIAAQTVTFGLPVGGPLAIILADFNAEAVKQKVKLNWSTVSEINNDYFTVERSTDNLNWTVVKTIKGAVNSSVVLNYECFDDNPFVGTAYYRVKQTDLNGRFTYSNTKLVKFTTGDNIYAYPVPNTGNTIYFKGLLQPKNISLVLHDAAGANVYNTTLATSSAILPSVKPGVYTLSLYNKVSGETTNLRYIKL